MLRQSEPSACTSWHAALETASGEVGTWRGRASPRGSSPRSELDRVRAQQSCVLTGTTSTGHGDRRGPRSRLAAPRTELSSWPHPTSSKPRAHGQTKSSCPLPTDPLLASPWRPREAPPAEFRPPGIPLARVPEACVVLQSTPECVSRRGPVSTSAAGHRDRL